MKFKMGPQTRRARRLKKEADHSRLIGGSFLKQENLHRKLVLGGHRGDLHTHLPKSYVYIEALMGFRHVYYSDGLNNTLLSQAISLSGS